jgi:hypothetical protein
VRRIAVVFCALLVGAALLPLPARAAGLQYSVKEARAYAYQVSLSKEVIENAPECDPKEDEYECDEGRYNHRPNCPRKIAYGREGDAPAPKPFKDARPQKGGSGHRAGGREPPRSSPVRLNEIISHGSLSRVSGLKEAQGFASEQYVDLNGRGEPEAHSESSAFSNNTSAYEERCWPKENAEEDRNDYVHVLSHSEGLTTYHFAECKRRACAFQAPTPGTFGASAERARSIVRLRQSRGEVVGELVSLVEELSYGGGAFTVDSLRTFVTFSSDGSASGLRWSAATTASGAKLGGQPVSLPPGDMVSGPGFSIGVTAPYVDAARDGSSLRVLAAGLLIATEQQTAHFAGAEISASFGEGESFTFPAFEPGGAFGSGGGGAFGSSGVGGGSFSFGGGGGSGLRGQAAADTPEAPTAAAQEEVLIYDLATGRGIVPGIVALGVLGWLLLMSRWLQRYAWGRKLYRFQPLKTIDWLYRAFVKT